MENFLKNLFPTIFYNVFNRSKSMLKVPIAAAQSRLPPLFLGSRIRKFGIFSIVIPIVVNCMESIGFHWNSTRGGGFGLLSAARRAGDGRKHFLSVPGVITTRQETSRFHISLRIGRSELTCLKWTTKCDTYCNVNLFGSDRLISSISNTSCCQTDQTLSSNKWVITDFQETCASR